MNAAEINSVINNICAKLEIPVNKGLEYIVAIGIKDVTFTIMMLLSAVMLFYLSVRRFKEDNGNTGVRVVLSLLGACCIFCFLASLPDCILYLCNPEAWAVQYLLNNVL